MSSSLHRRGCLPKMAPYIDLEPIRFEISVQEFNRRVKKISCNLGRKKDLSSFFVNWHIKIIKRGIKYGDIKNIF